MNIEAGSKTRENDHFCEAGGMVPLTKEELLKVTRDHPILVRTVMLDEETGEPDPEDEEWMIWDGHSFENGSTCDTLTYYGIKFIAYPDYQDNTTPSEDTERNQETLEEKLARAKACIDRAYWIAWARSKQLPARPGILMETGTEYEVMLALKGEIPIRGRKDVALAAEWKPCPRCEARGCRTCEYHGASFSSDPCNDCENYSYYKPAGFCPECGRPLTGEAWTEQGGSAAQNF